MSRVDREVLALARGPINRAGRQRRLGKSMPMHVVQTILDDTGWETESLLARAQAGITALRDHALQGDCWRNRTLPDSLDGTRVILVIVPEGEPAIGEMIHCVNLERGDSIVLALPVSRGGAYLRRARTMAETQGWRLVDPEVDPWTLLGRVGTVYTDGHEIGFLALLAGLKVRCFGDAVYAGRGLTLDGPGVPPHPRTRTIVEIFAAACILCTRYTNPLTGAPCTFEDALSLLAEWRRIEGANRAIAACVGMSIWKQRRMREMLRSANGAPRFANGSAKAVRIARKRGGAVAVWASREPPDLAARAAAAGVPVLRVEDGFLRSVGLGANFTPPGSIVVDGEGIYFDPGKPSGLDRILNETVFDTVTLARADALVRLLVRAGITKYNVGGGLSGLDAPAGRRLILVPGQVENDRSVTLGGAGIKRNIDLLRRVRAENPDAFIVYKPHPDVEAGHRPGALRDDETLVLADRVIRDVSTAAILSAVDEVHTLTSLAGFEGLLRSKRVVVHGQPFYAGWGLTVDRAGQPSHRRRRLTLEELVAGALIMYPRYLDPMTRLPCGPELTVERLAQPEFWKPGPLVRLRRLQGAVFRWLGASMGTPSPALAPEASR